MIRSADSTMSQLPNLNRKRKRKHNPKPIFPKKFKKIMDNLVTWGYRSVRSGK